MTNADHLAGALTLQLGCPVTWRQHPGADLAVFECDGHATTVTAWDLEHLDTMSPQARRNLMRRMEWDLAGS